MFLSHFALRRPILTIVINLLIILFGIVAFSKLPVREYPDIDPPVLSINTTYKGASAEVVEVRVTDLIEERLAGIEGIKLISSKSKAGRSTIDIEFELSRDIDDAANDVRDKLSRIASDLPDDADPPEIDKSNSSNDVMMWLNLTSKDLNMLELTDYADRYLRDRFSNLDGVARARLGGEQAMSLRVWLDQKAMFRKNVTVLEIAAAIRAQNVELPAGTIESKYKDFTVKVHRKFKTVPDFANLVIKTNPDAELIRLKDVARIELGAIEKRNLLRGNGLPMVGIGIIKQAKANTLSVANRVRAEMEKINETLPQNLELKNSYDTSVFISAAIAGVYSTLIIAFSLVVLIIYLFLGNARATIVPATSLPIALLGSCIILYLTGFSINLLTLLALVLSIGLVVDDAIVILENIYRRIELGESALLAAYNGTRQVGFAVIATTLILIAIFIPIVFVEGDVGKLFTEFAIMIVSSLVFSTFSALTLAPVVASYLLKGDNARNKLTEMVETVVEKARVYYEKTLSTFIHRKLVISIIGILLLSSGIFFYKSLNHSLIPKEDRGVIFMFIRGPEGASYEYMLEHLNQIEERLMPFVKSGEFNRLLLRAPGSFGVTQTFNTAIGIFVLQHWDTGRKPIWYYVNSIRQLTADIPGVMAFPGVRQAFGRQAARPIQFVISGTSYDELKVWRDKIIAAASKDPLFVGVYSEHRETKPHIGVSVLDKRAAQLGISVKDINETLAMLLGTANVTTFTYDGEEYDVVLESLKKDKDNAYDIHDIYVRSKSGNLQPLSNLVRLNKFADAGELEHYNKLRSITIASGLAPGVSLGQGLDRMTELAKDILPGTIKIGYKGESLAYLDASQAIYLMFLLAILVAYLVLAGQFESFVQPVVIMLTVPLAMVGALFALWLFGQTLNIYSQVGLIILIGMAAKNGILIVEFINQLRQEELPFEQAILEASTKRFRPIVMTTLTTCIGAVPLILASGAGWEARFVIGLIIFTGVTFSCLFTLFIIPAMYYYLAKNTNIANSNSVELEKALSASVNKEH